MTESRQISKIELRDALELSKKQKNISLILIFLCALLFSAIFLGIIPLKASFIGNKSTPFKTLDYDWQAIWSRFDDKSDGADDVTLDTSGNIYIVGSSFKDVYYDLYIVKFNSTGNYLWNITLNRGYHDYGRAIVVNGTDVFAAGFSQNVSTHWEIILVKYNTSGSWQWNATWASSTNPDSQCLDMTMDTAGNFYLVGYVSNDTNYDCLILKLAPNGQELWNVTFNDLNEDMDEAHGVAVHGDALYVVGKTNISTLTNYDAFLAKYNATTGVQLWNTTWGHAYDDLDVAKDVVVDGLGNIYVTGYYTIGTFTYLLFVRKYNSTGTLLWSKTHAGSSTLGYGIALGGTNRVYIAGKDSINLTSSSALLLEYNLNGTLLKDAIWDGPRSGVDTGYAVTIDSNNNTFLVGTTPGAVLGYDAFIVKNLTPIPDESDGIPGFQTPLLLLSLIAIVSIYVLKKEKKRIFQS